VCIVGGMFSTSTQRKYWSFHEQSELDQLREEVNHQYVVKNGGGDMDADVGSSTYFFFMLLLPFNGARVIVLLYFSCHWSVCASKHQSVKQYIKK